MTTGQQLGQLILSPICILILIHHNVSETALITGSDFLVFLQYGYSNQKQVIKIKSIIGTELALIKGINLGHLLVVECTIGTNVLSKGHRTHHLIFGIGNSPQNSSWGILLVIKIQLFKTLFNHRLSIAGIIYNKIFLVYSRSLYLTA